MKRELTVLLLFVALALVMTYPLITRPATTLRDYGDAMLNAWILAWDVQQISHLNIGHFFDANIFYPYNRTLAYSEHLLTESLAALPIALLTGNPVLAHNLVLLLGFITAGFGMYLLARHLTRRTFPSIVAGLIYAFNPFMFAHTYQVQVLWSGGIPLAFLFLHRYFENDRRRDLLLFALFFILQVLANGYYALFLSFFVGLFVLIMAVQRKKIVKLRFWGDMALAGVLIAAVAGPFLAQYVRLQKEMGFQRDIGLSASPKSFLATSPVNRLYGRATARNVIPEGELFPGAAAFFLAAAGVALGFRWKRTAPSPPKAERRSWTRPGLWIISALMLVDIAALIGILFTGGFDLSLGFLGRITVHAVQKPLIILAVLLAAGALWRKIWAVRLFSWDLRLPWIYPVFLLLSFSFTFGARGPYVILHKYLPGFNGIRVPARFHVIVMFALAVLAAFGTMFLMGKLKGRMVLLAAAVPILILAEYFSCPLPGVAVSRPDAIPPVYAWLGTFPPGSFAVAEIPFPYNDHKLAPFECPRVFYSAFHFQKLLNGYSGFFPPLYDEVKLRWSRSPALENVADLKTLGVKYMIFHTDLMDPDVVKPLFEVFEARKDEFRFSGKFEDAYVYEILGAKMISLRSGDDLFSRDLRPLSRAGWKATASVNAENAMKAIDDRLLTRWDSGGNQRKGQFFVLELGRSEILSGLRLRIGSSVQDYPRAFRVELSGDGQEWRTVASSDKTVLSILSFLDPKNLGLEVTFPAQEARFVRINNDGQDDVYYWSIHELEVFAPALR